MAEEQNEVSPHKLTMVELEITVAQIKAIATLVQQIPVETVAAILKQIREETAIMPILDPTLYRNNMQAVEFNLKFIEWFTHSRIHLDQLIAEAMQKRG